MYDQRDYAEEAANAMLYADGELTVQCECCGAEVAEDDTTDDGLCLYCARQ